VPPAAAEKFSEKIGQIFDIARPVVLRSAVSFSNSTRAVRWADVEHRRFTASAGDLCAVAEVRRISLFPFSTMLVRDRFVLVAIEAGVPDDSE
jgi:hypothetical protein